MNWRLFYELLKILNMMQDLRLTSFVFFITINKYLLIIDENTIKNRPYYQSKISPVQNADEETDRKIL